MKTYICFIRHGQTEWNNQTRIQGTVNNPLNDNGRRQAQMLGKYLKENNHNWDTIICSPLVRAHETAQIIANELDLNIPLIVDHAFTEREFGNAEGETITKELFNKIIANDIINLEKTPDLQKRVYEATIRIGEAFKGQRILIVAHSHVIKGLLTKLDQRYSFNDQMLNSALNYFIYEDGQIEIERINVSTHLN
jgi:broad specificity phosphatase PhoE